MSRPIRFSVACLVFVATAFSSVALVPPADRKSSEDRFAVDLAACNEAWAKGKKPSKCALYGKIQIVEHFPDVKIQVVEHFPDIKVKVVEHFPDDPGKWKFVKHFPDYKIQYVEHFPDYKIKFVEHFPGCD